MADDEEIPSSDPGEGTTPVLHRTSFACPRCGAIAHQVWSDLLRADDDGQIPVAVDTPHITAAFSSVGGGFPAGIKQAGLKSVARQIQDKGGRRGSGAWRMARCEHCEDFSVWRDARMIFPHSGTATPAHEDMPESARELYEEAREVVGISRRAGAALARASLERLLREMDPEAPSSAKLEVRIDRILTKVSTPLGDMLTVIRHVGNKSLHVEDELDDVMVLVLDQDQTEIVDLIFQSINDLVEELVTRPKRTRNIFDRLPQGVRDRLSQKAHTDN